MAKFIFSGIHYESSTAYFIMDNGGYSSCERVLLPVLGKDIKLIRHKGQYCTGYYDLETLKKHPCPTVSKVTNKLESCPECIKRMDFNPHFYNVKTDGISIKQQAYLNEPHLVYLAFFGGDYYKVGITNKRRSLARFHEQGARYACIIAECSNAYSAREIEHNFISFCGLKETIRKKTKRKLSLSLYEAEPVNDFFLDRINFYNMLNLNGSQVSLLDFFNLDNCYFSSGAHPDGLIRDISDSKPVSLSGRVIGIIGDNIFLECGSLVDLFDTNLIKTHVVTFEVSQW